MTGVTMTIMQAELDDSVSDHYSQASQASSPLSSSYDQSSGDEETPSTGHVNSHPGKELGELFFSLFALFSARPSTATVNRTDGARDEPSQRHTHMHT